MKKKPASGQSGVVRVGSGRYSQGQTSKARA